MPQIRPVSDLRNNFAEISRIVHEAGEPVFLRPGPRPGEGPVAARGGAAGPIALRAIQGKARLHRRLAPDRAGAARGLPLPARLRVRGRASGASRPGSQAATGNVEERAYF